MVYFGRAAVFSKSVLPRPLAAFGSVHRKLHLNDLKIGFDGGEVCAHLFRLPQRASAAVPPRRNLTM